MKNGKLRNITTWTLYIIYISSIIFFISEKNTFNVLICIICTLLTLVLQIANRKFNRIINNHLYIVSTIYIMIASLLGSCFGFYDINHYDDFLHVWSGFIACSFAYSTLLIFYNKDQIVNMNRVFIVIFLLMFSVAIAGFWEIGEFTMDTFLGTNTQVGGLTDTMIDMIDGLIGAVVMIPFVINKINRR